MFPLTVLGKRKAKNSGASSIQITACLVNITFNYSIDKIEFFLYVDL